MLVYPVTLQRGREKPHLLSEYHLFAPECATNLSRAVAGHDSIHLFNKKKNLFSEIPSNLAVLESSKWIEG